MFRRRVEQCRHHVPPPLEFQQHILLRSMLCAASHYCKTTFIFVFFFLRHRWLDGTAVALHVLEASPFIDISLLFERMRMLSSCSAPLTTFPFNNSQAAVPHFHLQYLLSQKLFQHFMCNTHVDTYVPAACVCVYAMCVCVFFAFYSFSFVLHFARHPFYILYFSSSFVSLHFFLHFLLLLLVF